MDTRLKSSKSNKKALRTAAAVVLLAAVCFAVIAVNCKDVVNEYYTKLGSDFESEDFVEILFQCNYVLYPEVLEKSGKSVRTEDLYLSFEEEAIPAVEIDEYIGNESVYDGSSEQIRTQHVAELQNNLLRTNSLYTAELGAKMDYCVIDEDTQTVLKNTTREIELLRDGERREYAYYLIVRYDQNGIISDIRVNGSNVEQFLKNARLVANSTDSLPLDGKQKTRDYVLVDDYGMAGSRVSVTQKIPQNATFIYAMTVDQMVDFPAMPVYRYKDSTYVLHYIGSKDKVLIYDRIGVGRIYLLFLAIITVVFGFLARYRPWRMTDMAGTKCAAELVAVVQWILAVVLYSSVVNLVCTVNEDFSLAVETRFFVLTGAMALLFGAWYWCLLSVCDIFSGLRIFLKKRSLIYRRWDQITGFLRTIRDKWKADLAGVDLGKDTTRLLKSLVTAQFVIVSLICCCWIPGVFVMVLYSVLLYWGLKRHISKVKAQYGNLMQATNAIAQGKFDNTFEGDFGIFESYKSELYQIQGGFRTAVEEEVKSQRMKTELITNVSHDLKTPLTAIITYIDLLKDENITAEQRKSYLETLERKSLRLKSLIEDLFEISKASSGNVKLDPVAVDICNLVRQVYLEHEDKMKAGGLDVRFDLPEEKIILLLDSQKTYRIFENLYINAAKYALPNTRVYVQAKLVTEGEQSKIHIEIKNISAQELTVSPTDLTERFVRGDASRNTEGSGLGLAIAKSFTELQLGRFVIETDGDLFKAVIEWRI